MAVTNEAAGHMVTCRRLKLYFPKLHSTAIGQPQDNTSLFFCSSLTLIPSLARAGKVETATGALWVEEKKAQRPG